MRKFFTLIALCMLSITVLAQNKTRMGAENRLDFGGYLSMSDKDVHWNGSLIMDINSAKNNGRTRISLGWLERTHFCPFVSGDYQYLIGKKDGLLYLYPTVGIYAETFRQEFQLGAQAGLGLEFQFSNKFAFFTEGEYQYLFLNEGIARPKVNAGIKFAF